MLNEDEVGFQVTEPIEFGDISNVRDSDDKPLIPPTNGVILRISKPKVRDVNDRETGKLKLRFLSFGLQLRDGIDENGKFKNMYLFKDIMIWASSDFYAGKDWASPSRMKSNVVGLVKACELDLSNLSIDDKFLESIDGKFVCANIIQKKSALEGVAYENDVKNFKALTPEQMM